ncbi:MAG: ABC transporter permease [Alphaproteobacteria bacterium]|nr:ABC transporter permease [Alphaproteobacteria bacterium]
MSREPLLLLLPAVAGLVFAFVLPVAQVLALAFLEPGGGIGPANFAKLFADAYYPLVAERTIRLGVIITLVTAVLGVPLAYLMHRAGGLARTLLTILIVLPLMTSVVIRTFGWLVILGRGGLLARVLEPLGLAGRNFSLMHTEAGIVLAMSQVLLPFMTLTVLASITRIDPRLEEAARVSGAGFAATLRHVVLPLAKHGIVSGSLLVFALAVSSFVTPMLVGGVRLPVLAGAIYQQVTGTLDWSFAATQATLLLLLALVVILPYARLGRARGAA